VATGITQISDLNSLFNTIFEDALFVARETNIMTNLVTPFSARGWMARKITTRPQIAATAKAEGEDFATPTKWSKSLLATLTPSMIMAQVIITDEEIETDPEDSKRSAAQDMGNAIASKIDTDLCSDFTSFSTDKGPGASGTATIAKCAAAIAVLRNSIVPNPINIVMHAYHWYDIWMELGQPAATKAMLGDLANQALKDFYVGDWLNARWFVNANIAVSGTDAVSGIFNPQALCFDSRKAPDQESERDASRLAWELNFSAGYAHGVRRPTFGVKYTADATEPS